MRRANNIRRLMTGSKSVTLHHASLIGHRPSTTAIGITTTNSNGFASTAFRQNNDRRSSAVQQQQTSHVIVVVTIMFTLCNSLSFIISVWEAFELDLFSGKAAVAAFLLLDLSNVLVVFNSATTFLFYLRYCTKYRKLFLFYCASMAARHRCCRKFMNGHLEETVPVGTVAVASSRRSTRPELTEMLTASGNRRTRLGSKLDEPRPSIFYPFLQPSPHR